MTWFLIQETEPATLPMIQQCIHAHRILKRQLWNYLMTRIWFLIGLALLVWWQNLANFRLCFSGQTLIIAKLHLWQKIKRVKSRSKVKLLGITIDDKLPFATHMENLCSRASNRLRALAKKRKFISFEQVKHLSEVYIMSTFTYCPLIWMFCSKTCYIWNGRCKFRKFIN